MDFYENIVKGAVVVVHFGTTHNDTKEKTIDIINEHLKNHFGKLDFYQVFTSRIINRILAGKGVVHLNTSQMLEKLKEEGYKNIIIQPTYVINGIEMEALRREVEKYSSSFEDIRVGTPLLSTYSNYVEIIEILDQEVGVLEPDMAVVLAGHGTDHSSLSAYPMLDYVAKDLNKPFYVGTVEGYPTIETVIKLLKKDNKKKIILRPLMFVAGEHAKNDIAIDWKNELEANGFEVTLNLKGLGELAGIHTMFLNSAIKLENQIPEDILKKKEAYAKGIL